MSKPGSKHPSTSKKPGSPTKTNKKDGKVAPINKPKKGY